MISGNDFDNVFKQICSQLYSKPIIKRRNLKIKEIVGCYFKISSPLQCILSNKIRKLSYTYLNAELKWYLDSDLHIKNIKQYAKMWENISDDNGFICSNYGYFVFEQKQIEWVINKLIEDIFTRQALINYNQPKHKFYNNKDFVCTIGQQFIFNSEKNQLDCYVFMRSCDIIYGLSYDVPWFIFVFNIICTVLNIKIGDFYHFSTSLHIYEKHFTMLHDIVHDNNKYISTLLHNFIEIK